MWPQKIFDAKTIAGKRELMRDEVSDRIERGEFFITDVLSIQAEPYITMAWEAVDGVALDGAGIPRNNAESRIEAPSVRVIVIDPGHPVRMPKWTMVRRPGTNQKVRRKEIVTVREDEILSHRDARYVLTHHCWPAFNDFATGQQNGNVVEVEWLVKEILRDECLPEIREMYERLRPRIEVKPEKKQRAASAA